MSDKPTPAGKSWLHEWAFERNRTWKFWTWDWPFQALIFILLAGTVVLVVVANL